MDAKIDPEKPEILTYVPTANDLVLLAAEYFKADADQDLSTDGDRPTLFGRAFDGPMLGHAPGMPKALRPPRLGLEAKPERAVRPVEPGRDVRVSGVLIQ
jgi:hypothetical protein